MRETLGTVAPRSFGDLTHGTRAERLPLNVLIGRNGKLSLGFVGNMYWEIENE